jgi:pimeloyl-ACP methyl ester carboxylesterase
VHTELVGSGPRIVLVHGSVTNGAMTWGGQGELADRYTLAIVDRTGYPPNDPVEHIDFEEQAIEISDLLEPGDHLVGHSYGGVISLLAAARRPELLRSLTVCEPPAFGVARGQPAVEEFLARFHEAPRDPRGYLEFFLPLVGSAMNVPDPLPPDLEAGTRAALAERPPHEAEIRFDVLAAAPFPTLVVSGAHNAAFDAVCDVLEERLGAERAFVPGAGHSIPRMPEFNERLEDFLGRS